MYLHLIEKAIINSSLRHSKMVQNGQLIYTDNLFLLYMPYCFVWHILTALILAEYRASNRVKMAGSTYQDNMVKMMGWNGRVEMSFFYICCTTFLPSQVFLFLERLCAGQHWFHWEWTKTKSDKLMKNVCLLAILRAFLSQRKASVKTISRNISDWSTLGHVLILDQSLWAGGCGVLGLHTHLCGGRSRRWGYWLEGTMEQQ